jgi:hypothetical protein
VPVRKSDRKYADKKSRLDWTTLFEPFLSHRHALRLAGARPPQAEAESGIIEYPDREIRGRDELT